MPDLIGDGLALPPPPRLELPPGLEAGSDGAAGAGERQSADPAYESDD